ncbi:MAG: TIGR02530 family flagellar biosynthesis protein [Solirubrobacteraceae bacterium]|jgi:flagellar operon protein
MSGVVVNPALLTPGVAPATTPATSQPAQNSGAAGSSSFADVLAQKTAAPQFSRHALARLEQRGITLDQSTVARVAAGINRAAGKGSRDSVVFVDNTAYVVSVRNNTVITAVDSGHMREHVFTNIDSAVIA